MEKINIGIIGGSGFYKMKGLKVIEEKQVKTPFGEPSDKYVIGKISGREVAFLSRHSRGHKYSPSEINYRANIYGFKKLGVENIISVSAVGSLKEKIKPLDIVLVDQYFDRTFKRKNTFFENGIVAHIAFGEPVCSVLREIISDSIKKLQLNYHNGGTYINIEGPHFSTKAESNAYRKLGFDVVGMTNATESKLAREAEICYVSMALVTDYDCWKEEEEVCVDMIIQNLIKNTENAQKIIKDAIYKIPDKKSCLCKNALDKSIITDKKQIPKNILRDLDLLIGEYIKEEK